MAMAVCSADVSGLGSTGSGAFPHAQTTTRVSSPRINHSTNHYHYKQRPDSPHSTLSPNGMASFRTYPYPQQNAHMSGSQDSLYSLASSKATSRSLMANSSDASQATVDTDVTSPISPPPTTRSIDHEQKSGSQIQNQASKETIMSGTHTNGRLRTPEDQVDASSQHSEATSPMSIITPVNGVKRTANGLHKRPSHSALSSPVDAEMAARRRTESVGSSGSRASEAAAQLKTRLAYAMAKVQRGWEHRPLAEVEQLAASLSPRTKIASPNAPRQGLTSPRAFRPTDGVSLPSARIPLYEPPVNRTKIRQHGGDMMMSPPAKRRSGQYESPESWRAAHYAQQLQQAALGPPAEIGRSAVQSTPPSTARGHQPRRVPASPSSKTPTTPKASRKPASIRTQTQTAKDEQDAMAALMLMGSPSNSQFPRGSQQSSAHQSPRAVHFATTAVPRQALQYRSDSTGSISRSSEGAGSAIAWSSARDRANMLEDIEAGS